MIESATIEYAAGDGIAIVGLNRPEKRNALNTELVRALRQALERAADDREVRVILLRGMGRDFCAGLDVSDAADAASSDAMIQLGAARPLAELYLAMRRHRCPIVAAVHGRAIGGGAGLATAADLILATESAELRYAEVNLGFVAAIVMSMLRRSVGEKQAFEMLALGEPVSATAAQRLGIVNQVCPDDEFEDAVIRYVTKLGSKSASALSLTKDLLYHIDGMSFEAAIHAGLYGNALARMTPDARAGFERFTKKRKG